jgi:hypothetical protein
MEDWYLETKQLSGHKRQKQTLQWVTPRLFTVHTVVQESIFISASKII